MNGQRIARLVLMLGGWGGVGANVAYSFGIRRLDLLVVCGVMAGAAFVAVAAIAFLIRRDP